MGHEAIEDEPTTEEEIQEELTTEDLAEQEDEVEQPEEGEQSEEDSEEVEIVREDSQSHTSNDHHGIQKRVNKLNKKVEVATGAQTEAEQALALEQEKTRLLQMQIEQQQSQVVAPVIPNPDDFDLGVSDPKYAELLNTYIQSTTQAEVQKQVAAFTDQTKNTAAVDEQSQALIRKQTAHYEKVKDLKVKNYLEREDAALSILGNDAVNYIIRKIPDAHNMLYYLGTDGDINRQDAERLAHLARTDAETLLLELGGLNAALKVKPKSKTKQAPDPDENINGDVSTKKKRKGPTFE